MLPHIAPRKCQYTLTAFVIQELEQQKDLVQLICSCSILVGEFGLHVLQGELLLLLIRMQ